MGWYLIELPDDALTPYVSETEDGLLHGWGEMPKREIDLDALLIVVKELEQPWKEEDVIAEDVEYFEHNCAKRIRKAVGCERFF